MPRLIHRAITLLAALLLGAGASWLVAAATALPSSQAAGSSETVHVSGRASPSQQFSIERSFRVDEYGSAGRGWPFHGRNTSLLTNDDAVPIEIERRLLAYGDAAKSYCFGLPFRCFSYDSLPLRCGTGMRPYANGRYVYPVRLPIGGRWRPLPLRPLWIGLALNTALFASIFLAVPPAYRAVGRAWRLRSSGGLKCPSCSYEFGSASITRCPECAADRPTPAQ